MHPLWLWNGNKISKYWIQKTFFIIITWTFLKVQTFLKARTLPSCFFNPPVTHIQCTHCSWVLFINKNAAAVAATINEGLLEEEIYPVHKSYGQSLCTSTAAQSRARKGGRGSSPVQRLGRTDFTSPDQLWCCMLLVLACISPVNLQAPVRLVHS